MKIYRPMNEQEVAELIGIARMLKKPFLTKGQTAEGMQIDWQFWDQIRQIDRDNMTATVERAVLLGDLADQLAQQGLQFAPYTEDLREVSIGQFYGDQMAGLTVCSVHQPKLHILGLEVILANGDLVHTGGKVLKVAAGYDMNRLYISSRETLALPLVYLIKLEILAETAHSYLLGLPKSCSLSQLKQALQSAGLSPRVNVCWNHFASKRLGLESAQSIQLFLRLQGSAEQVKVEQEKLQEIAVKFKLEQIELNLEQVDYCWQMIKGFREQTVWPDGFKVPTAQTDQFVSLLDNRRIGFWCTLLQGSFNVMPTRADEVLYRELKELANQLGVASNWYWDSHYGLERSGETKIWLALKEKFDPQNILNPELR